MAIQMRRGLLANYDEDKMVAGELAVTTDSTDEDQKVFVAFAPGDSKRILTETDLETVESVSGMIAPDFDASTTYAAGDYVIYGDKLYQFTSAHTGAWTGTDAEVITVAGMLDGVETTEIYVDGTSLIINTALVNGNEVSF